MISNVVKCINNCAAGQMEYKWNYVYSVHFAEHLL